jgi:hypothetical protein
MKNVCLFQNTIREQQKKTKTKKNKSMKNMYDVIALKYFSRIFIRIM